MVKRYIYVVLLFVVLVSLTSCTMPLPTCDTASLQEVTLSSPAQLAVVDSLSPTLQWTYPSDTCAPEGYAITLWEGPVLVTNIGGGTGNPSTSWGPGSPLQPGKQYRWTVAPINGTTLGPASSTGIFFTGPVCTDAGLIPPTMLEPADGAIFNQTTDLLWWDYTAGCTPTGYQADVATDPTFASGLLAPGPIDVPLTRLSIGDTLVECETYYWRVAARNGATVGPYSPTRSFVADTTGTCEGVVSPPDSASISGIVWHDVCALPDGPLPDPLSAGCVSDGAGSARANGIREAGEPGIPGVQVDLHFGGCATEPVTSVITDSNGQYTFDGLLVFGSYCVAIRPLNPPNDSILIPGDWTYPPSVSGTDAFANAEVDTGTILTDKDFGWDYQFLPAFNDPTPTPVAGAIIDIPTFVDDSGFNTPFVQFIFEKNAFCRKGPGVNYPDTTAIPAGDTVDVLGISPDTKWIFINWAKFNATCWVATNTGKPLGDFSTLAILTPVPSPVPTAIPATKVPQQQQQPTAVPTQTPIKP